MKQEKLLQVVNLAPNESSLDRLMEMHPMQQIVWATIIQVSVFGLMLVSFSLINLYLNQ